MKYPVLIITGPTGSGKTEISEGISRRIGGEIISVDTRTAYRGLDIGTGKFTMSNEIHYHMVDFYDIGQKNSTYEYVKGVRKCIEDIRKRDREVIITGGSINIIYRLIKGMDPTPPPDPGFRHDLEEEYKIKGGKYLWDRLSRIDVDLANKVHSNNKSRLIRYLEISLLDGSGENIPPLEHGMMVLFTRMKREMLKKRIKKRLEIMIGMGFIEEVKGLMDQGWTIDQHGMDSIGYPEVYEYLRGDLTIDELKARIISNTWNYARKQMNWYKRLDAIPVTVDEGDPLDQIMSSIDQLRLE